MQINRNNSISPFEKYLPKPSSSQSSAGDINGFLERINAGDFSALKKNTDYVPEREELTEDEIIALRNKYGDGNLNYEEKCKFCRELVDLGIFTRGDYMMMCSSIRNSGVYGAMDTSMLGNAGNAYHGIPRDAKTNILNSYINMRNNAVQGSPYKLIVIPPEAAIDNSAAQLAQYDRVINVLKSIFASEPSEN